MKRIKQYRKFYAGLLLFTIVFGVALYAFADYYRDVGTQLKLFNSLYKKLVINYVDQVDPNALIEAGINGMLKTLDPYTVYLEDQDREGIQTLTRGEYGGVGIQLGVRNDTLTVIAPMEEGPAARAGVQSGDRIIQIDTLRTTEMSLSRAAGIMRGKPGTVITITILRPGIEERIPYVLQRESIVLHDLAYSGMVGDGIAYLKLTSFSKNSADEIEQALRQLGVKNMKGLILDLRDNPGGLLSSALKVADMFIDSGKELLSTRGHSENVNKVFYAKTEPLIPSDVPITVLVNHGSASASEIVTGILQDLDRAIIIGHETFGKGLVQSVLPLSSNASLKITTAKYYIPSGRLIQRQDYFKHDVVDVASNKDSVFFTQNKRRVYGGGGITPDLPTKNDTLPDPIRLIRAKNHFFQYAVEYHNRHADATWPFRITPELQSQFMDYLNSRNFRYTTRSAALFRQFLASVDSTDFTRQDLENARDDIERYLDGENHWKARPAVTYWIRRLLTREFAYVYAGNKARIESMMQYDEDIRTALQELNDQDAYLHQLGYLPKGQEG